MGVRCFPPTTGFEGVLFALLLLGTLVVISAKGRVWTNVPEAFLTEVQGFYEKTFKGAGV